MATLVDDEGTEEGMDTDGDPVSSKLGCQWDCSEEYHLSPIDDLVHILHCLNASGGLNDAEIDYLINFNATCLWS
jgi:hypothetical protein